MGEIENSGLERFRIVATRRIKKDLADHFADMSDIALSAHAYFISSDIVLRAVQKVWGRELERQEHEYPRDWWQAFKAQWFPAWAKNKWPVEMTRVVIVARELYPNVAFPEKDPIVAVEKFVIATREEC